MTALEHARSLPQPARETTLRRDIAVQRFWTQHTPLFVEAWREWEQSARPPVLDEALIAAPLRDAVSAAWTDPSSEDAVRALVEPLAPGVSQVQLFDAASVAVLRDYLAAAAEAEIPVRPPYGIVLNRQGATLDPRSEGYLAAPGFQAFYRMLMDRYLRPIGRLLFPEVTGYDSQTFGFSIHYRPDTDTSIRPHTDAAAVTSNLNLNLPHEAFTGSEVDFFDPSTRTQTALVFAPGMAVLHRGDVPHAARRITSGERTNLVLWVYGEQGQMPPRSGVSSEPSPQARWTIPQVAQDGFAPF